MIRVALLLSIFLVSSLIGAVKADEALDLAKVKLNNGDLSAKADLEKIVKSNPESEAYKYLGQIALSEGDNAKAIEYFSEALKLNEVSYEVLLQRGIAYFEAGQYDKATQDLTQVIDSKPTNEAYLYRAKLYNEQKLYKQALLDLSNVDSSAEAQILTEQIRSEQSKSQISDCQKFDQGFLEGCNKSCPTQCVDIAIANKKVKSPKEKIEQMCKESCAKHCAIRLEDVKPSQCSPEQTVSGAPSPIVEKGLFDNANQQYTKLVYDGLKKMAGQQFQQAIIDFTSAIKLKSDIAEAYFHRGEAKYKLADFSGSVKDFMETLNINPGHPKAQVLKIQAIKQANKVKR